MTATPRPLARPVPGRNAVYGAALNYRAELQALGATLEAQPYGGRPRSPVLYLKPANTWIGPGEPIPLPADIAAVRAGASLAAVIGRDMCAVAVGEALGYVAGYTVVTDVHVPHTDFFRPVIQNRCRDGFCPIADTLVEPAAVPDPDALEVRIWVNGALALSTTTAGLVRPVATLLADISTLFTLAAGDLVLVGAVPAAPLVRTGDRVAIEVAGVGRLENPVVAAPGAPA